MHKVISYFGKAIFRLCGFLFIKLLGVFGRTQLSGNALIRGLGYFPLQIADRLFGLDVFRIISYIFRVSKKQNKPRRLIKNTILKSYLYVAMSSSDKGVKKLVDLKHYRQLLAAELLDEEDQYQLGHQLFQAGKLGLACETFADLITPSAEKQAARLLNARSIAKFPLERLPLERRLQLYRDCGITHFMLGRNREALQYWQLAGELRRFILGPVEKSTYRIIGASWFAAIGHVAMLDFYNKYIMLFRDSTSRTVIQQIIPDIPGSYLVNKFRNTKIAFLNPGKLTALEKDHDKWAKQHGMRLWSMLTAAEKFACIDDFWEFEFPDGAILGYTHAAAKIQQEWERRGLKPLLSVNEEEQEFINSALEMLGVPKGAWYVCLHVREPGFHRQWNNLYPSMRDAEIEDYHLAIEEIVARGGWVIRMGDPTMKRLKDMPGVVDYAHSPLKTPNADVLIPLGGRFLLGTNSGYATVPNIYGVRCAFTNWVPIGLPLWSSQDLMIPKLFWHKEQQRHLSLDEIFETGLAYVQNWTDMPAEITLTKNTPEDIWALAEEMLTITANDLPAGETSTSEAFHPTYRQIAERHGSYAGSHLGSAFIRRHPKVFTDSSANECSTQTPCKGDPL